MFKWLSLFSCAMNIFWGMRIFVKKPKTPINVLFAVLAFSMSGWCIAPFVSSIKITLWALLINTLVMGFITNLLLTYKINMTKVVFEDTLSTPINYDFKKGNSYIIVENNPEKIFGVFSEFVNHGVAGLCLTREEPSAIRTKFSLSKVPILHLVAKHDPYCLDPRDLKNFIYVTEEFISRTSNGIIIIDGIEFLAIHNDPRRVLSALEEIAKTVKRKNNCILVVSANIIMLGEDNIELLKKFMKEVK